MAPGTSADPAVQLARLITIVERLETEFRSCMQQMSKTLEDHESRLRGIERDDPWSDNCKRHAEIMERLEGKLDRLTTRIDALETNRDKTLGIKEFLPWIVALIGGTLAIIAWIKEKL